FDKPPNLLLRSRHLFPYTTLFRSARLQGTARAGAPGAGAHPGEVEPQQQHLAVERALLARGERDAEDVRGRRGRSFRVARQRRRSEEHTSELQSREKLVCRLLLEK